MGFIRVATCRDAADAASASIFGNVELKTPLIGIEAIAGSDRVCRLPVNCENALSTDAGPLSIHATARNSARARPSFLLSPRASGSRVHGFAAHLRRHRVGDEALFMCLVMQLVDLLASRQLLS